MPVNRTLYEGKTALISGASSRLGRAFAEALAQRGTHLMLVAPSAETLQALATTLSRLHAVSVEVIAVDLSQEGAVSQVSAAVEQLKRRVDILIDTVETLSSAKDHQHMLHTAVAAADLTQAFLLAMLARGRGIIVYSATKTFVLSFSRLLWAECRQYGVQALALCVGAPNTECVEAVGSRTVALSLKPTPEVVVAKALRTLEQGRSSAVPGLFDTPFARIWGGLVSLDVIALITKRVLRRISKKPEEGPMPFSAFSSPTAPPG